MIVSAKDIYNEVSEENSLDPELVKSVGSAVFQELRECLNNPRELAYELPKIGTFSTRFKKFENFYLAFVRLLKEGNEKAKQQLADDPERFEMNTKLYEKVLDFREKKKEKRNERYKSSEDKSEEH